MEGIHIADRRAGKKAQLGQTGDLNWKRNRPQEIGLYGVHRQARKGLRQRIRRMAQELARDIDRHISGGIDRAEQDRRLGRGTRPELDHRGIGRGERAELGTDLHQQRSLGAGGIVFGEIGDRLEQLRTAAIVEPPRGNRARLPAKAAQHIGAEIGIGETLLAVLGLLLEHCYRSLARRTPVNCQRWCG